MFNLLIIPVLAVTLFVSNVYSHPLKIEYPFPFVSRDEWGANNASSATLLGSPVSYVVIHHSYEPEACFNQEECARAMRSMQNYHQLNHGWNDIGYNFAVGSDGVVYEGRGWNKVGAHTTGYNTNSIGVVFIGDWRSELPPQCQLRAVQQLISTGILLRSIKPDYMLIGHRQVANTECPGDRLFKEITGWKNFDSNYESS